MTKREAAIVACYADVFIGSVDEIYWYLKEVVGRPIMTHEIPTILVQYHDRIKQDFIALEISE